jgi:hypothetical protein
MNLFKFLKNKYYEKFDKNKYYEMECNITNDLPVNCLKVLMKTGHWGEMSFVINDIRYNFNYNADRNEVNIYVNNDYFAIACKYSAIAIHPSFEHDHPNINIVNTLKNFVDFINEKSK